MNGVTKFWHFLIHMYLICIFQERLRSLHRYIYDIEAERGRSEQCIDQILRAEKAVESSPSNDESSGSSQQVIQYKFIHRTLFTVNINYPSTNICMP